MKSDIISIGIFFDGTGNNGINATSRIKPPKNNKSYYSNTTNIYKLFELFNGNEKAYIEGIGTITGAEDNDFAMATCKNPAGYKGYSSDDKMARAFTFMDEHMHDKTKEYHLYAYGFNRGAMLARNFCHEIVKQDSKIEKNIKVKFLGVFDTVESVPFNHYNVAVLPGVERALHLCAINECRYFFPLTGFFEDSKEMKDTQAEKKSSIWKEIFVPGANADVGGGYLEVSQSVYVSTKLSNKDVEHYVKNVKNTMTDADGNKIWNYLLEDYKKDEGPFSFQAYVSRDVVYNDLSKVYGILMLAETNISERIFKTDFSIFNFKIDTQKHPYLITLLNALKQYITNLSFDLKPVYDYGKLANYTHISANFGPYKTATSLQNKREKIGAEQINTGLNVAGSGREGFEVSAGSGLQSEVGFWEYPVIDFAHETNIPNNDNWNRTILMRENFL